MKSFTSISAQCWPSVLTAGATICGSIPDWIDAIPWTFRGATAVGSWHPTGRRWTGCWARLRNELQQVGERFRLWPNHPRKVFRPE